MRALVLGLVGVVMAAGGAVADPISCRSETSLMLVAKASDEAGGSAVSRPDLIGKEFTVIRVSKGPREKVALLSGGGERIVLQEIVTPRSAPATHYVSFMPNDPKAPRLRASGKSDKGGQYQPDYAHEVFGGPLSGLALDVKGCRP